MEKAFTTPAGQAVWDDAAGILTPLMYKTPEVYSQDIVGEETVIKTL